MAKPVYSFVIPIFNEQDNIDELYARLCVILDQMDGDAEVVLVDDGSRDGSYERLIGIAKKDARFQLIRLSRNFGHQVAITAGMDFTLGQAVIIMDADLQDPPEVVLEMSALWRQGYDVVYGVRDERKGETWFKLTTAALFYRFLRKMTDVDIPADVGDFRLVDRKALNAFKSMRERARFVRGMFSWVGFKQIGVRYQRAPRFAGKTSYPLKKMIKLAIDGILGFSTVPMRITLNLGLFVSGLSLLGGFWALILRLTGHFVVPGWTSLFMVVALLSGVQLIVIGVLGEYIGRIYDEVRNRPLYIVSESYPEDTPVDEI